MLDDADSARRSANSTRRVERELFNSLRRDKVDSILKMQVRVGAQARCVWHHAARTRRHSAERHGYNQVRTYVLGLRSLQIPCSASSLPMLTAAALFCPARAHM